MRGTRWQRLSSTDPSYRAVPHPSRLRRATFPQRGKAFGEPAIVNSPHERAEARRRSRRRPKQASPVLSPQQRASLMTRFW